jgi:hypothetical protein
MQNFGNVKPMNAKQINVKVAVKLREEAFVNLNKMT